MEQGGPTQRSRLERRARRRRRLVPYALLVPAFALLGALAYYPLAYNVWLSIHHWDLTTGMGRFSGTAAYRSVLSPGSPFWSSLVVTLAIAAVTVSAEVLIGFGLALLVNSPRLKGRRVVTMLLIAPMVTSPVVVGLLWRMIFDYNFGPADYWTYNILHVTGHVNWLGEAHSAVAAIMVADTWYTVPLAFLILLAGLQSLPVEPFEAAAIDGASRWQSFRHLTLPLMRPFIAVAVLLRLMDALRIFDNVWVMTSGGPGSSTETLSVRLYRLMFSSGQFDQGAATAVVMTVFVLAVSLLLVGPVVRQSRWEA